MLSEPNAIAPGLERSSLICLRLFLVLIIFSCGGCAFFAPHVPEQDLRERIVIPGERPRESTLAPDKATADAWLQAAEKPEAATGSPGIPAAAAPYAPERVLTLQQAIGYAYQYSPRLKVLHERVIQAKQGRNIAFAAFLPEAVASYRDVRGSNGFVLPTIPSYVGNAAFGGSSDSFQNAELNLQWTVWDFGRTPGRFGQARAAADVAELQYERGRQTVAFNVTAAYFSLLQKRALSAVAEEAVRRAQSFLNDAKNYLQYGTAVEEDVLQAELLLAEMQLELVSATTAEGIARAALNRVVGLHVSSSTTIQDIVAGAKTTDSLPQCLQRAVDNRCEFRSVLRTITSSQLGLGVTQAEFLPRVLAGGTAVHQAGQNLTEHDLLFGGVNIELALFKGGKRLAEVRSSESEVRAAVAQAEEMADTIAYEVIAAFLTTVEARQRIALSESATKYAKENLRVLIEMFNNGDATATDVITAELALVRAQQDYFTALYGYQTASAQLDYATGGAVANAQGRGSSGL